MKKSVFNLTVAEQEACRLSFQGDMEGGEQTVRAWVRCACDKPRLRRGCLISDMRRTNRRGGSWYFGFGGAGSRHQGADDEPGKQTLPDEPGMSSSNDEGRQAERDQFFLAILYSL